ncbi:PAS domain S-box protein [Halorutilales archaeon Cl-col2-1]
MDAVLLGSVGLRVVGVVYSIYLLYQVGDPRFGYLTLMLSLMATRQILTYLNLLPQSLTELPGLVVSFLALVLVYYLVEYTDHEAEMQEALRERNEKLNEFRKAIEHAGHSIYITDDDGRIEYVNEEFEETTGYSEEEVVGGSPEILKSGKQDEKYYDRLWRTLREGEVWEEKIINRRKDGKIYTAYQTIAPVENDEGEITKFVAVQSDITKREMREQRLEVLHRILRHNLRNSLNLIKGNVEILLDEIDDDYCEEKLVEISESADSLVELSDKTEEINETIEFVRNAETDTRRVSEIVDEAVENLCERYPEANVSVEYSDDVAERRLPVVLGSAVEEVVENGVLHNDSGRPCVSVEVSEEDGGDRVRIDIDDNAGGIPEYEREVLRTGEETPLIHGSGLGLWFVYWILRMVGGSIEIEDTEAGSRVSLLVPTPSE